MGRRHLLIQPLLLHYHYYADPNHYNNVNDYHDQLGYWDFCTDR